MISVNGNATSPNGAKKVNAITIDNQANIEGVLHDITFIILKSLQHSVLP